MEEKDESGEAPPRPDAEAPARRHQPLSEALSRLYQGANPGDAAPGGIGEFALARSNPVPVASLEECRRYLGRLRCAAARALFYDRATRPHHATYGDGSPIEAESVDHIHDVLDESTVPVDWQRGDVLWIDNRTCMHGRAPFRGSRRIMLAMSA